MITAEVLEDRRLMSGTPVTVGAAVSLVGTITEFPVSVNSAPSGIATVPDGDSSFTENSAGKIGRITPSGVVTEFGGTHPE